MCHYNLLVSNFPGSIAGDNFCSPGHLTTGFSFIFATAAVPNPAVPSVLPTASIGGGTGEEKEGEGEGEGGVLSFTLLITSFILLETTPTALAGGGVTLILNNINPVSKARLPAWCAAARGVGTMYINVLIPRVTWSSAR